MPQTKMENAWTLFPDFLALVPLEAIAGPSPTITNFSEITKSNSFVINDVSADSDLILNEDGVSITYTKTSDAVRGFDAGGLGDVDDVTIERTLSIEFGINGYSHDIFAMLLGLDPKTDIEDEMKFLKDDTTGVFAAGAKLRGNIQKEKFLFYARVPLADPDHGNLYCVSPKVVIQDGDIPLNMQNQKVTQTLTFKGLKLLNSAQLTTLQGLAEPISNGYELWFNWNAASEAYV